MNPSVVYWLGPSLTMSVEVAIRQLFGKLVRILRDPTLLTEKHSLTNYLRDHPDRFVVIPFDLNRCVESMPYARRYKWQFRAVALVQRGPHRGRACAVYDYTSGRCEVVWSAPYDRDPAPIPQLPLQQTLDLRR